jgi:hypothetical protein
MLKAAWCIAVLGLLFGVAALSSGYSAGAGFFVIDLRGFVDEIGCWIFGAGLLLALFLLRAPAPLRARARTPWACALVGLGLGGASLGSHGLTVGLTLLLGWPTWWLLGRDRANRPY